MPIKKEIIYRICVAAIVVDVMVGVIDGGVEIGEREDV